MHGETLSIYKFKAKVQFLWIMRFKTTDRR